MKTDQLNWYEFGQNNTEGSFEVTDKLCHRLFIQATSSDAATAIAESMGVYFDGCDDGRDCPCCGDRWYRISSDDFIDAAELEDRLKSYGPEVAEDAPRTIETYAQLLADKFGWTKPDARLFYADGTVKEIFKGGGK